MAFQSIRKSQKNFLTESEYKAYCKGYWDGIEDSSSYRYSNM